MIERKEYLDFLIKLKDKNIIKVVTGIRRCGKSTLLSLYQKYLIQEGILQEQIIAMNFENPVDNRFDNWRDLYNFIEGKLLKDKMNYIFLDEIQMIKNFEKVVDGLFIKDNVDLYITGSNSYMLSGELATYLTGRYMQIHMLPLSFKEYLSISNGEEAKEYQNYLENGGFPYLIHLEKDKELIRNYLDGIYNTVLMKDVVNRNNIKDILILDSIIKFIFDNIGQLVSTNKISNTLNSNHRKNSVNTVESYLSSLLDSYMIYKVTRYDIKGKEYLKTGDKYYVCDLGLRNYLLGELKDIGSILENIVFLELLRRGYTIYTGKNGEKEIDFIATKGKEKLYFQVAYILADKTVIEREFGVYSGIDDNYPKYVLSMDNFDFSQNGIIHKNIMDWLLEK